MQGAFLSPPLIAFGGRFVDSVSEECQEAGYDIKSENGKWEAPGKNYGSDKCKKAGGKHWRKLASAGEGGCSRFLTDKRNATSLRSALTIRLEFVGYKFVPLWSALAIGKRTDMQEHLLAPIIRQDEAITLVILPCGDAALVAHGKRKAG